MGRAGALLAGLAALPAGAIAQEAAAPFVTVDQDRLFAETRFGQRVIEEIRAAEQTLADQNRRIEETLGAEERALTERRETMAPEAFRELAADFDDRVVAIRQRQDAKQREVQSVLEEARQAFWTEARPVLAGLVQERGAAAILNDRAVILSARSIDITEAAIERIDSELGAGSWSPEIELGDVPPEAQESE